MDDAKNRYETDNANGRREVDNANDRCEALNNAKDRSRVALITGGSGGIGAAIALELAGKGFNLAVNYLQNEEQALKVVSIIKGMGRQAIAVSGDVGNSREVEAMVNTVLNKFGRIDVLVNNAGVTRDTLLLKMQEEHWERVLTTNLKGVFLCCRAVVPYMLKGGWGRIINLGSIVGQQGRRGQSNYAAAKAGVLALSKSLAHEVTPLGITVNVVVPGFTETGMSGQMTSGASREALSGIPLGRKARPEEIAGLVGFLCSPEAGYISGQVFNADCRIG